MTREKKEAEGFAKLVDDVIAGRPLPPALDAEARALVETAAMIRASLKPQGLGARSDQIVEAALSGQSLPPATAWAGGHIPRRSDRARRILPWATTVLAAAAAVTLWLRHPAPSAPPLRDALCSRPADALVGQIDPAHSADARARLDAVYADRLSGYRELLLSRGSR